MEIIIVYNQIHWFCQVCNTKADLLIQKLQTLTTDHSHTTDTDVSNSKAIAEIVTESLNKVSEQFTKALKDVKDYIKMSLDEKNVSTNATTVSMDTSQTDTQPLGVINSKNLSHGGDLLEVVDEYVEREKRKNNLIVHNLPEPTEVTSNGQRVLKDTEALNGLFHTEFKVSDAKIQ